MRITANTRLLLVIGAVAAIVVAGCSVDDPTDPTDMMNPPTVADASARYVAVGNSLTAGFMDGGLMQAGQVNSFPRLIATQLGLSSAQFTQPWVSAPGIGSSAASAGNVAGVLYFDGTTIKVLAQTPEAAIMTLLPAVAQTTPYHNLGVPGATLHDGMNAYDEASSAGGIPFFDFINRASLFGNHQVQSGYPVGDTFVPVAYETASQFSQCVAKGPALVTLWLGNNDVLGPATGGDPAPGFGAVGSAPYNAFYSDYINLLSMLAGGLLQRNGFPATIVAANIPSITDTPYFVPEAVFDAAVQQQLGQSWPAGYQEAAPSYVLFPALSWVATAAGSGSFATPIPSRYTLTAAEAADVEEAVANYNAIIAGTVNQINAAGVAKAGLVDANALLDGLDAAAKTHFLFLAGQIGATTAAQTTLFSLDGIHPNNRGYGVLANAFIARINELDGTSIPAVDWQGLTWDPTYGTGATAKAFATAEAGGFGVDPEAAAAMAAMFR